MLIDDPFVFGYIFVVAFVESVFLCSRIVGSCTRMILREEY